MAETIQSVHFLIESRQKDAIAGDRDACYDLGLAYSSGPPPAINLIEAYKWFSLAAILGHKVSEARLVAATRQMTPRELAEARRRVRIARISPVWQASPVSVFA